jgi:hypothetical protein
MLSPNFKNINIGLTNPDPHGDFIKWPLIISLNLHTGDTSVILLSEIPNDSNAGSGK